MGKWIPCKRRDFIHKLRQLGFEGPFSGTRHQFMLYQDHRLTIPSNSEYSVPQLRFILREVEAILGKEISSDAWAQLK